MNKKILMPALVIVLLSCAGNGVKGKTHQWVKGKALSVNVSSGGMLVLMDETPAIEQVMKVYVPTPLTAAETPTLAEVRWTRKLPVGRNNGVGPYFVGLKFIF